METPHATFIDFAFVRFGVRHRDGVTAAIELKPHEGTQIGIKELAQQSRKLLETTQQLLNQFPE